MKTSSEIHKIVQVSSCGLVFLFSWCGKLLVFSLLFFTSLCSVTLPGTHDGRFVLTRGEPILLCSLFFQRFLGFLGSLFGLGFFFGFVGFFALVFIFVLLVVWINITSLIFVVITYYL